ncbi:hypothetical protein [Cellulomonas xylanilytica]|uniref:Uncharacterized protein n=1 Tax=Cellulomonas xylanilytica TaxID=233583 RepID=A0A510V8C2_9CELL|nr:hypothetical protein [Cellulomonas xylanilytica]GEK23133.1 hypothetical protein CXY01_36530 [Cellulomonas xylanilytica]
MSEVTVGPNTFGYGADRKTRWGIRIWLDGVQGDATYKFEPDPASKIKEKDAAKFYLQVATAIGTSYNGANAFPPVGTTVTTRLAGDVRLDAY